MKLAACICLKVLEIIFTVATLIFKKLSDKYSERLLTSNQKRLTEWRLLNTLSLTREADEFSFLIFTGYTFLSVILLICRFTEKDSNYHICEIILLSFGVIFFTVQGLLTYSVVEQLQEDISVFSYALGALSFTCALLFALDLLFFRQMSEPKNAISQTDLEWKTETASYKQAMDVSSSTKTECCQPTVLKNEKKLKYLRTDL